MFCPKRVVKRKIADLYDMGGVAMNTRREGEAQEGAAMGAGGVGQMGAGAARMDSIDANPHSSNALPPVVANPARKKPGIPSLRDIHW